MYVIGYPILAIFSIIDLILLAYSLVVVFACVISFVNADPNNQLVQLVRSLTYPVFNKVRPIAPIYGNIDLAPIFVFIMILFIRIGIVPIFMEFANGLIH